MKSRYRVGDVVMKCSNCGAENPWELKFCGQCGSHLDHGAVAIRCSMCGFINNLNVKYCGGCGKALSPRMMENGPSALDDSQWPQSPSIKTSYVIGGGLVAAIFFGVFYWAITYTWTEQVWHEIYMGIGYNETVTHSIDPVIQALSLVIAIFGLIVMVYGVVSRGDDL